jgi:enediyne biosynthesis protein E4
MRPVLALLSIFVFLISCNTKKGLFQLQPDQTTGIEFNNAITEYDSFNILTFEYIYNGGGVGIGDFNNDGLSDIFFSGNMVENQLYQNLGNLKFKNISSISKVTGDGKWCSGIAVVDVNADGRKDIYVCATAHPDPERRRNILYINQGNNKDGVPLFKDLAPEYNLNDTTHATNAAFLDYDNDGDLDLFLAINKMTDGKAANIYRKKVVTMDRVDRLYRNDFDSIKGHPVFTNVSQQAGIIYEGYSLGVNVTDINQDGWVDIYVTNDYLSEDLLYINQHDGTFQNESRNYFKHTSHSAMGNDVVDVNNDGLPDVIAVDMLPEDNFRKKTMLGSNNYTSYINNEKYNIQHQYVRNTLQLNQGKNPVTFQPIFSDVSFLAGISATDWSWTPSVSDFDNDGFRDIIITNGFPKDVTDRDFIEFHNESKNYASVRYLMNFMPSVKISNYAFRNSGDLNFQDVTEEWGMKRPSFSNGAAYADLDNDGDLDYIVNNINDRAFVYKNCTIENAEDENVNWLKIHLYGYGKNIDALGAKVWLYHSQGHVIYADNSPFRGYLSSVEPGLHFGLGKVSKIDSLVVQWPNESVTRLVGVKTNQVLDIKWSDRDQRAIKDTLNALPLFQDISSNFSFVHSEQDFVDFNVQPLLLHKLSQFGPGAAVGDVNNDGLDDIYIGGTHNIPGNFFVQKSDGSFVSENLFSQSNVPKSQEELGVLFFDADNDGDMDLYSVSGGNEFPLGDSCYLDLFFENVNGTFVHSKDAVPTFLSSGSCVKGADYDRDGDIDLFVGGRHAPQLYPAPVSSYLLRNDSKKNKIRFTIVNEPNAPALDRIGMVCDALWSDFDNDGWVDLIVAGEWMPLRFFKNVNGKFSELRDTGVQNKAGWWNSIAANDFDNDGDIDYVVGNLGRNTLGKASEREPISIYTADFDNNEGVDMIPTAYFKNQQGVKEEFPYFGRLDVQKELIKTKAKFLKHSEFAKATIHGVLNDEQYNKAKVLRANWFSSSYFENMGNGKFTIRELPVSAQFAPVFGMVSQDVNDDGNFDLVMVGNDFGSEVLMGRQDAFSALTLIGDGKGSFNVLSNEASGVVVSGDAKALISLEMSGRSIIMATQNRGGLRVFGKQRAGGRIISLSPEVARVIVKFRNGSKRVQEVYYGQGFLSQSSRGLMVNSDMVTITTISYKGEKKVIRF